MKGNHQFSRRFKPPSLPFCSKVLHHVQSFEKLLHFWDLRTSQSSPEWHQANGRWEYLEKSGSQIRFTFVHKSGFTLSFNINMALEHESLK